ncbi:glycosyltransferase family 4 protein [Sphingomonas sp. DG1-23]|uniref:glycosyltransferase family 4 protein n=1 Tax=Sphingomonas sp. DG1-23 TaxID=3068316 RepID=UPI00273D811B|nr:glycosyltransferase family 4 protein [Sphingomonas sp. DG1-23]MDP5279845.1 glycosyltransferase family 4 protein [Sphingomonas sp. DG1-23]
MLRVHSGQHYTYQYATPRVETDFRMSRGAMRELGRRSPFLAGAIGCRVPAAAQLVHTYNGVPTTLKPFVVSCESFLPRIWNEGLPAKLKPLFQRILASDHCRAIVPMSEHAATLVRLRNAESPHVARIAGKVAVIYPSVEKVDDGRTGPALGSGPVTLTFVGRHFGRKGGIACLYLSDRLERLGIRHEMHIVSIYESGPHIWTDTGEEYYRAQLREPRSSVSFHSRLSSTDLAALLRRSHFALLPTIDETFGLSVLDAMALGCVPLATGIRALPELVPSPALLLRVETDALGRWRHLPASRERRCTADYRLLMDDVQHSLAEQAAATIGALLDTPNLHAELAEAGLARIRARHHPVGQAQVWSGLYHRCIDMLAN